MGSVHPLKVLLTPFDIFLSVVARGAGARAAMRAGACSVCFIVVEFVNTEWAYVRR